MTQRIFQHFTLLPLILIVVINSPSHSQAGSSAGASLSEERLSVLQIVTEIPTTAKRSMKLAFSKEATGAWTTIIASTAVLIAFDQHIYDEALRLGERWDLESHDKTKTISSAFGKDILRLPSDKGSALYFLGDGWTHMAIAGTFLASGYFANTNRAFNTGVQMVHGMVVSTFFNQALKRSFGHETPNQATQPRGAWRPFPTPAQYNENSAKYDALPSGHIMTATMTFTILYKNYPEYGAFILPVGGIWLTALGFQMVNNGVHWASDYPLGIGMGYLFAVTAIEMGKPDKSKNPAATADQNRSVFFAGVQEGAPTLNWAYYF